MTFTNHVYRYALRWGYLAALDTRIKYRRTVLGPIWMSLGTIALLFALGPLFASLQGKTIIDVLPSVCIGLVLWIYFASTIGDCATAVLSYRSLILQGSGDLVGVVLRVFLRNTISFAHSAVGCAVVFFLLGFRVHAEWMWVVLGLFVVVITLFSFSLVIALLGARFRDLPYLVSIGMQTLFFLTPIAWLPNILPANVQYYVNMNPFAWSMSLIRAPLLDGTSSGFLIHHVLLMCVLVVVAWAGVKLIGSKIALWI